MRDFITTPGCGAARFAAPRRLQVAIAACAAGFALSGCSIPVVRDPLPNPPAPEAFPEDLVADGMGGSSATTSVADFFRDPELTALIEQAFRDNFELKILAEEIRIAGNEVFAREGAFLPFVDLAGGASIQRTSKVTIEGAVEEGLEIAPETAFPAPLPGFLAAAEFSWELDIWKRLRNAKDAASLHLLATAEGRNYVVTRLVAEIAEAYYELRALDMRLGMIDQVIAIQSESLSIAEAKKLAARDTELAVQRFQAEVRKNESERLLVQQEIVEAEARINRLVGRYPQPVERGSRDFLAIENDALRAGIPSELLRNRPDIRRAELEIRAAGLDIEVARAAFYPRFTLTGGAGFEANDAQFMFQTPESIAARLALGLVAPILNTQDLQAEFRTANARQLIAMYEYQRTVLSAFTEVATRMSMVRKYRESIAIRLEQLRALEASVSSASQLFQSARIEYSEVLFAQRDLLEARLELVETKREQLAAVVSAYQAVGGGSVLSTPPPDGARSATECGARPDAMGAVEPEPTD